jgi:hypothetical protein
MLSNESLRILIDIIKYAKEIRRPIYLVIFVRNQIKNAKQQFKLCWG